jgi:glucosamine 6-phosphate synthetase-like amidotransferase/phosphosugar isomerase protein
MPFDPGATLPGAPTPWGPSAMPELRAGPPFVMTKMIAAEPALAVRLARRLQSSASLLALADAIRLVGQAHRPVVVTGCGTSEHAAMACAILLTDALAAAGLPADFRSAQALETLRLPIADGLLIAISHEGGTWATNQALTAARAAGAGTALISVSDRSPAAAVADLVVTTDEQDQSWCHTIGYLSPLVVGATLAGMLRGEPLDVTALSAALPPADGGPSIRDIAAALAGCDRLLTAGSGMDHVSSRELALKVEEGARLPATALELETVRHGHLAAANERTGFVLFLTDTDGLGPLLVDRAAAILRSVSALGMPAAAIRSADLDGELPRALTPAGRVSVALAATLPRRANVALASAIPLQLLAEALARLRGVDPDTLGREDPHQSAAASA